MIWITAIFLPLLIAVIVPFAGGPVRRVLVPLAPLPALWLALFVPADAGAAIDSLVLGTRFGFGRAGQIFLLFTAGLWLVAAIYGQGYFSRDSRRWLFHGFFLLTMTGNFGLILALDVPSFYTFFALMTFSAFGMVIHTGTPEAKRAARIYLITAVAGEALLLGAVFLAVGAAGSTLLGDLAPAVAASDSRNLIILLAFFGFGVKAGALPVHFWLPLAHPVAPVPASAVLSGAMIKAGLLGWWHFLPMGHGAFPGWSLFCIATGLAAAFGAAIVGSTQNDPKTALAYSSISQMGVMTVILGIGLSRPEAWTAALPVLLLYALNHALAKGALFFGAGIARSTGPSGWSPRLVMIGLLVPVLVIAGAPWTGGAMVKDAMKDLAGGMPGGMVPWLDWLLPLTAAGTSLLLGRFLWLVRSEMRGQPSGQAHPLMWIAWLPLIAAVLAAVAFAAQYYTFDVPHAPSSPISLWKNAWPILLGILLLLGLIRSTGARRAWPTIPAGDLVVLLERAAVGLRRVWSTLSLPGPSRWAMNFVEPLERLAESERRSDFANRLEERLRHRSVPGVLFIVLALGLMALLIFGTPVR